MKLRHAICCLLAALAGGFAGGCASVSTVPLEGAVETAQLRRPERIWVRPFTTDDGMWLKDTAEPAQRAVIQDWLTGSLLQELADIAPTFVLKDESPSSGWMVTGRFLRVNPGSRAGRLFFGGLGAGKSELETRVMVFDLAVSATDPVLSFSTTGGSHLATGLHGAMNTTDDDINRTAREITAYLEDHLWPESREAAAGRPPAAIDEIEIAPASPPE